MIMGMYIHRAIGYGMSWHNFEALTTLDCEAHKTLDCLHKTFKEATNEQLTIPKEVTTLGLRPGPGHPPFLERRLLAKRYTDGGRLEAETGRATDLYLTVTTPDETTDVVFFPNLMFGSKWQRSNDEIDYHFERWRDGTDRSGHSEPRDFVKYVAYGHYPYTNYVMTIDGKPHEWLPFWEMRERPNLVPNIPSEIRWYMKELGILDEAGVNQLRPLIAQWWS
jgi:hypothetical protein